MRLFSTRNCEPAVTPNATAAPSLSFGSSGLLRMQQLIFAVLVMLTASPVFATPQFGDPIAIGVQKHYVHGFQLPEHVAKRLAAWKKKHGHNAVSSANWDGFHVDLRVTDGLLYLDAVKVDSVRADTPEIVPVPMRHLFGNGKPPHAKWFSGELAEYLGKPVGHSHVSRKARVYRFDSGRLVKIEERKVRW